MQQPFTSPVRTFSNNSTASSTITAFASNLSSGHRTQQAQPQAQAPRVTWGDIPTSPAIALRSSGTVGSNVITRSFNYKTDRDDGTTAASATGVVGTGTQQQLQQPPSTLKSSPRYGGTPAPPSQLQPQPQPPVSTATATATASSSSPRRIWRKPSPTTPLMVTSSVSTPPTPQSSEPTTTTDFCGGGGGGGDVKQESQDATGSASASSPRRPWRKPSPPTLVVPLSIPSSGGDNTKAESSSILQKSNKSQQEKDIQEQSQQPQQPQQQQQPEDRTQPTRRTWRKTSPKSAGTTTTTTTTTMKGSVYVVPQQPNLQQQQQQQHAEEESIDRQKEQQIQKLHEKEIELVPESDDDQSEFSRKSVQSNATTNSNISTPVGSTNRRSTTTKSSSNTNSASISSKIKINSLQPQPQQQQQQQQQKLSSPSSKKYSTAITKSPSSSNSKNRIAASYGVGFQAPAPLMSLSETTSMTTSTSTIAKTTTATTSPKSSTSTLRSSPTKSPSRRNVVLNTNENGSHSSRSTTTLTKSPSKRNVGTTATTNKNNNYNDSGGSLSSRSTTKSRHRDLALLLESGQQQHQQQHQNNQSTSSSRDTTAATVSPSASKSTSGTKSRRRHSVSPQRIDSSINLQSPHRRKRGEDAQTVAGYDHHHHHYNDTSTPISTPEKVSSSNSRRLSKHALIRNGSGSSVVTKSQTSTTNNNNRSPTLHSSHSHIPTHTHSSAVTNKRERYRQSRRKSNSTGSIITTNTNDNDTNDNGDDNNNDAKKRNSVEFFKSLLSTLPTPLLSSASGPVTSSTNTISATGTSQIKTKPDVVHSNNKNSRKEDDDDVNRRRGDADTLITSTSNNNSNSDRVESQQNNVAIKSSDDSPSSPKAKDLQQIIKSTDEPKLQRRTSTTSTTTAHLTLHASLTAKENRLKNGLSPFNLKENKQYYEQVINTSLVKKHQQQKVEKLKQELLSRSNHGDDDNDKEGYPSLTSTSPNRVQKKNNPNTPGEQDGSTTPTPTPTTTTTTTTTTTPTTEEPIMVVEQHNRRNSTTSTSSTAAQRALSMSLANKEQRLKNWINPQTVGTHDSIKIDDERGNGDEATLPFEQQQPTTYRRSSTTSTTSAPFLALSASLASKEIRLKTGITPTSPGSPRRGSLQESINTATLLKRHQSEQLPEKLPGNSSNQEQETNLEQLTSHFQSNTTKKYGRIKQSLANNSIVVPEELDDSDQRLGQSLKILLLDDHKKNDDVNESVIVDRYYQSLSAVDTAVSPRRKGKAVSKKKIASYSPNGSDSTLTMTTTTTTTPTSVGTTPRSTKRVQKIRLDLINPDETELTIASRNGKSSSYVATIDTAQGNSKKIAVTENRASRTDSLSPRAKVSMGNSTRSPRHQNQSEGQNQQQSTSPTSKNFSTFQKRKQKVVLAKHLQSASMSTLFQKKETSSASSFNSSAPNLTLEPEDDVKEVLSLKSILLSDDTNDIKRKKKLLKVKFADSYHVSTKKKSGKNSPVSARQHQPESNSNNNNSSSGGIKLFSSRRASLSDIDKYANIVNVLGAPWINDAATKIQSIYRASKTRQLTRIPLLQHKIRSCEQRKQKELMEIQEEKWKTMDTHRRKLEKKYVKREADANLAEKLSDILARDNEKIRGQVSLMEGYCEHLTEMNKHLEETSVVYQNNYATIQCSMDVMNAQNSTLQEKVQRLIKRITEVEKEISDLDELSKIEQKTSLDVIETMDSVLNAVQARCKNIRLVGYVFALRRALLPDNEIGSNDKKIIKDGTKDDDDDSYERLIQQYNNESIDSMSYHSIRGYGYASGGNSVFSGSALSSASPGASSMVSSTSSNLTVLLEKIAIITGEASIDS